MKWFLIIAVYAPDGEWEEWVHAEFKTAQECVQFAPNLGLRDNEFIMCIPSWSAFTEKVAED